MDTGGGSLRERLGSEEDSQNTIQDGCNESDPRNCGDRSNGPELR